MDQLIFYIRPASRFNMFFWQSFQKRRLIKGCELFANQLFTKHVMLDGELYTLNILARKQNIIEVNCTGRINDDIELALKKRIYKMLDIVTDTHTVDNILGNESQALFPRACIKIPGCFSVYESAVRTVLGQQVSIKRATDLISLFTEYISVGRGDSVFPEKEVAFPVIKKVVARLPLTLNKRNALIEITEFLMTNSQTHCVDINDALNIKGVGSWTIDNIRLRGFLDPDIWMGKDLIIRKVCAQMGLPDVTDDFYYKFSPYRSYLTLNLWHIYNLQNHVYDDMFFIPESVPATPFNG
ncbi:TPA: hypothetical protein ACIBXN_004861 [Salmonella enterica subsp. diarizonae serovar 48:i:z]